MSETVFHLGDDAERSGNLLLLDEAYQRLGREYATRLRRSLGELSVAVAVSHLSDRCS